MKLNKIDIFLITVFILVIAFIISMIVLFAKFQSVPDSLVAGVLSLAGGECGILGWIKSSKERKRERRYELEDRKYNDKKKKEDEQHEDTDIFG